MNNTIIDIINILIYISLLDLENLINDNDISLIYNDSNEDILNKIILNIKKY